MRLNLFRIGMILFASLGFFISVSFAQSPLSELAKPVVGTPEPEESLNISSGRSKSSSFRNPEMRRLAMAAGLAKVAAKLGLPAPVGLEDLAQAAASPSPILSSAVDFAKALPAATEILNVSDPSEKNPGIAWAQNPELSREPVRGPTEDLRSTVKPANDLDGALKP